MNTEYTSFEPPEEKISHAASKRGKTFHWWPPGFLGEDEHEPLFTSSPEGDEVEEDASDEAEDLIDALSRRLTQASRVIDRQAKQINELAAEIDRLEDARCQAKDAVEKVKRSYRRGIQFVAGSLGLVVVLVFHREICQVGWNLFRWGTVALNLSPEDVVGFLTAATTLWLLWKGAKWLWHSAAEEFFGEGDGEDDLGDR